MGSMTTGQDPFYTFSPRPIGAWSSTDSEAYAPMSDMGFAADKPTGGSSGLSGIEIIWADQTSTYIRSSDMFIGYDPDPDGAGHLYWSLVLDVVGGVFDNTPAFNGFTYDATEDIFEDDGATPPTQTKYRFRLITQGSDSEGASVNTAISVYGQYREVTTCINGAPFQRLTKVT